MIEIRRYEEKDNNDRANGLNRRKDPMGRAIADYYKDKEAGSECSPQCLRRTRFL